MDVPAPYHERMADAAAKHATYADIEALPDTVVGELVGGVLYTQPRPAPPHALAATVLAGELGGPYHRGRGGPGGWWVLLEPELHLGEDVLVPDLGAWRVERMGELPAEASFTLAPDWVCEVLSPSTAAVDRAVKMPAYARAGVHAAWLVDPILRILEVYLRDGHTWRVEHVYRDAGPVRPPPFDAVDLPLEALWSPPAGAGGTANP
jgi:Uma2 family endonuclease